MDAAASPLHVSADSSADNCLLVATGVLDSSTYLALRNAIIKAALDEPASVIVDVTALSVPASSAWAVFTSARWHVSVWPDVPLAVVCAHAAGRESARRSGITRYVPVYAAISDAVEQMPTATNQSRRRARAPLPEFPASLDTARAYTRQWLTQWSQHDFVGAATTVVTVLVENVGCHTDGTSLLRVESTDRTVTVAVDDCSPLPPTRREDAGVHRGVRGLDFLDAVSRIWGQTPTSGGKTVWAVIGPENRL